MNLYVTNRTKSIVDLSKIVNSRKKLMNQEVEGALIIFVRKATLGKVKTRIAKTHGDETALSIYTQLLDHTRIVAEQVPCERYLFYSEDIDHNDSWSPDAFSKFLQQGNDLGAKMQDAFETVLRKTSPVIIIGSDCASLTEEDIRRAFHELEDNDVVIGPANDGGYYLLGMNDLQLFLFQDMPWSQENLIEETIFKIQDRGLRYALLSTKSDIDYYEDWEDQKHLIQS